MIQTTQFMLELVNKKMKKCTGLGVHSSCLCITKGELAHSQAEEHAAFHRLPLHAPILLVCLNYWRCPSVRADSADSRPCACTSTICQSHITPSPSFKLIWKQSLWIVTLPADIWIGLVNKHSDEQTNSLLCGFQKFPVVDIRTRLLLTSLCASRQMAVYLGHHTDENSNNKCPDGWSTLPVKQVHYTAEIYCISNLDIRKEVVLPIYFWGL